MAGELKNRLADLREQREVLESALLAISQKLPLPDEAYKYLNARLGIDAAMVQSQTGYELLLKNLDRVQQEIRKCLPSVITKPVAIRMMVTGKDLSQYETP